MDLLEKLLKKYSDMASFETVELETFSQTGRYDKDTPAHVAAYLGNLDDLKVMIKYMGQECVNTLRGDIGNTVLHSAILAGNVEVVTYLLQLGADPHLQNDYGDTAFDSALGSDNSKQILQLLKRL
ncbi:ankyrin repeat domain-containing protein [Gynuella sp.]|uniref:ankyrin repeat domain-containing protein n=1 Tax=Gynuella sp. TaxID=2969146 RepID=UPI003D130180